MSVVLNALNCKCPHCKKGNIFNNRGSLLLFKIPKMSARCNECDFKFEREPGFFFGAMFVSYALVVAEMVASVVVLRFLVGLSFINVIAAVLILVLLLSTFNFRISRSIWIYMFYKNR